MKKCSERTNSDSTSSQIVKDEELNNRFLDIAKKQMIGDGYDEDELTEVVTIMPQDNYPTNFTLDILAKSSSDNVPLTVCKKDFKVEVRECKKKHVTEIDNYSELVIVDPSYANYPTKM